MKRWKGEVWFSPIVWKVIALGISLFVVGLSAQAGDSPSTDKMRSVLLRSGGWVAEWKGAMTGETFLLFEDRGGKIVVQANNPAWNLTCERDVTLTADTVQMDGCRDTGIVLRYDPDDKAYPFKGESKAVNYKLREK